MAKKGRPVEGNPKNKRVVLRLTDDEYDMLEYLAMKKDVNRSEAARKVIRAQYNLEKYLD